MSYDPYDGEYYERELDLLEPDTGYDRDYYDYDDYNELEDDDYYRGDHYVITSKDDLAKLPPHIEKDFRALFKEGENPFRGGQCYDVFIDLDEMTVEEFFLVNVVE